VTPEALAVTLEEVVFKTTSSGTARPVRDVADFESRVSPVARFNWPSRQ
jgi:hypothetical protein